MASLTPEEKIEFLLQLLVTGGEFSPNYGELATKMGINTNSNAQRRLKGIVEADKRFLLQSSGGTARVVPVGEAGNVNSGSDTTKKVRRTPKSAKGRKRANLEDDGDDNDNTPSKSNKKSKKDTVMEAEPKDSVDDQEGIITNEDEI